MAISVRELPPLRLSLNAVTPSGKNYRWGEDEPNPANIPGGINFSSTMPGGFEQGNVTLPRKSGTDYSDLERLTTLTVYGPGGDVAWEGRLERAPRQSGDQMAISPAAVGWQAHLEDDKSAKEIYVDRDLSRWGGPSNARQLAILGSTFKGRAGELMPDPLSGQPSLYATWGRLGQGGAPGTPTNADSVENWYDGQGIAIGSLFYSFDHVVGMGAGWINRALLSTNDTFAAFDVGTDHVGSDATNQTVTATTATKKFAATQTYYNSPHTNDGTWSSRWYNVAVFGNHGLTKRGTAPDQGFYASDIVGHAVPKWAPLLTTDIQSSQFVIAHLAFLEPVTAGEIVRQATRFGLQDWAVWENKLFVWHNRGERGRSWRARISPSQLEETGASIERLYESIIVQYQDVDGSARTVGPPGSGANTESTDLKDDDPENPANKLGITRRDILQMGTSTAAAATEVGRRFLEEQKLLDSSGRAILVGHVEDDHGVLHPAWRVRAGDTITFVDAADTHARRIVKASYDHGSRTCSVDLDAPPEGLKALLERLGVVLVPLGLS